MFDFQTLNEIAARVTQGEYRMFLSMYRGSTGSETCHVTLEKGSSYGQFHLKVEAVGATPSEAFETALRQFPQNPIDGIARWDTKRLAATDGDFKEVD